MQYLLYDPNPTKNVPEFGGFASGLIFYGGARKPGYNAYRLPLFLPVTSTRPGRSLEVWGCVRPAHFASLDTGGTPQQVQIQFQRGSRGAFTTLRTVTITSPRGYFDLHLSFPASGTVRLAWSYPGERSAADARASITPGDRRHRLQPIGEGDGEVDGRVPPTYRGAAARLRGAGGRRSIADSRGRRRSVRRARCR